MNSTDTARAVGPWLSRVMHCPPSELELAVKLDGAESYVLMKAEESIAWVGLIPVLQGQWALDIAVKPEHQRRWMTKEVISKAKGFIFNEQRRVVLLEGSQGSALKLALRLGAKQLYDSGMTGIYALSDVGFSINGSRV